MKRLETIFFVSVFSALVLSGCGAPTPDDARTDPAPETPTLDFGGGKPRPALVFEPTELPDGQAGQAYEARVSVSRNVTPAGGFFLAEGTLPPGLELVVLEGEDALLLSGTPSEAGVFIFTLGVWCFGTNVSGQEGQQEYQLVVH
jgi:hypothetical protein